MRRFGKAGVIARSRFFDRDWYLAHCPEAARDAARGGDPARHYLRHGAVLGCDPGPGFSAQGYLDRNPDVAAAGLNPLLHYERHGRAEGRSGHVPPPPPPDPEPGRALGRQLEEMRAGTRPGLGHSRATAAAREAGAVADYAILTPTGDRPAAFQRCLQMVASQSLRPRQWLVVDDGRLPLAEQMALPDWVSYLRRDPSPGDPPHTLSANLLAGLDRLEADRVLIFEDDDWYAPLYAEFMLPWLERHDLAGLNLIRYYHLGAAGQGGARKEARPPAHTALAQTGFRRGPAAARLAEVCRSAEGEIRDQGLVDRHWWHGFDGPKALIEEHPGLHLGLKGGPGRPGLASGHGRAEPDYIPDPEGAWLARALGPDAAFYTPWQGGEGASLVLYTVLPEGAGPEALPALPEALAGEVRLDCHVFTPEALPDLPAPWQQRPLDGLPGRPDLAPLQPVILPHLFFPAHEKSLWVEPGSDLGPGIGTLIERLARGEEGDAPATFSGGRLLRRHGDPGASRAMAQIWRKMLRRNTPAAQDLVTTLRCPGAV
ncbi:hypothetical protein E0K89_019390 [Aquicoccus sp. SCR17]|nr:hypothetical protein [Carideicomes alvinocaridis]